ncbi:MAG: MBL fold metallo-hydrolase [Betaproteobacteria bacterium]|nr:MBL fold metallo-hydrolase [Betaproteobacteria bacterium]
MDIDYLHVGPPQAGEAVAVAPGVMWLRMPLPFALNHVNLWLLRDGGGWTAVDTGISLPAVQDAWRGVLAGPAEGLNLRRQIVTHCHPDHIGLAWWLEREHGAPLWITAGEYMMASLIRANLAGFSAAATLEMFARHGLAGPGYEGLARLGGAYARGVPALPDTFVRLRDGECLRIGDNDWTVMVGYGHSVEHAALHCRTLGVLISGDMLLPRISTNVPVWPINPADDMLGQFLESIERFLDLPGDTLVLPSHGLPFRGIGTRVEALRAHHRARCEELLGACAKPKTAAELLPVLFQREIDDPHQVRFAMGEAIAHLVFLERRGKVGRIEEAGIMRWARRAEAD